MRNLYTYDDVWYIVCKDKYTGDISLVELNRPDGFIDNQTLLEHYMRDDLGVEVLEVSCEKRIMPFFI